MTKSTYIKTENGRMIPLLYSEGASKKAVIVLHGSCSCKESSTGEALEKTLAPDVAVFRIDLPGHGESNDRFSLSVRNAISDVAATEAFARSLGYEKIGYFGSSLGAYLTIVYAYFYKKEGASLFLRSAAIKMGDLMQSDIMSDTDNELEKNGYYFLDEGFAPPIAITKTFLCELAEFDTLALAKNAKKDYLRIQMVHACDDDVAPIADAKEFASIAGGAFSEFSLGGHRIGGEGREDEVMAIAKRFFFDMEK